MKKLLIFGGLAALAIVGFLTFSSSNKDSKPATSPTPTSQIQETTDAKAAFAIFTNGTVRIFTATMYHNLSPDVYIESSNPNIVRVKKAGKTWNDFFTTLPMKLSPDCLTTGTGQTFCSNPTQTLKFYINGQLTAAALDEKINDGDKLLVSYGDESGLAIERQLQQIPIIK